jgi:hypothetical protein
MKSNAEVSFIASGVRVVCYITIDISTSRRFIVETSDISRAYPLSLLLSVKLSEHIKFVLHSSQLLRHENRKLFLSPKMGYLTVSSPFLSDMLVSIAYL